MFIKPIFILLFFIQTSLACGQHYPDFNIDEEQRPIEFYFGDYNLFFKGAIGGRFWELRKSQTLKFGRFSDKYSPIGRYVGTWAVNGDSVKFNLEKRKVSDYEIISTDSSSELKFRLLSLKWITQTDEKDENGKLITLITYCTVLLNDPLIDIYVFKNDLSEFVNKNQETFSTDLNIVMQTDNIIELNRIIRKFLSERELYYRTVTYWNGYLKNFP